MFMSHRQTQSALFRQKLQAGASLLEVVFSLAILLVIAGALMSLAAKSLSTTETQGHLAARTTEYAEDKMEQLLALKFCDGPTNGTDVTQFPGQVTATGTGLAGCNNPGGTPPTALSGGGINPTAPVQYYVDYLDLSGTPSSATLNWEYIRVWQISVPAGSSGLKQISVLVQARTTAGASQGQLPTSTVVALKSFPF
jgi:hypothetical protein